MPRAKEVLQDQIPRDWEDEAVAESPQVRHQITIFHIPEVAVRTQEGRHSENPEVTPGEGGSVEEVPAVLLLTFQVSEPNNRIAGQDPADLPPKKQHWVGGRPEATFRFQYTGEDIFFHRKDLNAVIFVAAVSKMLLAAHEI